ncbi:TMEM175 family protein [Methylomagnum ishizawai]|uniref:TMEM175 family protein n=1 Tax=Methylomagnum ishizawai TaxID=1760988 RepID=UPI001C321133|nr:TMEM175 family protein [Methylomagnum ishizawai]BBL73472.1 hypothetical protein MishRS11D_05700 [Methylomagnum ishizawai]
MSEHNGRGFEKGRLQSLSDGVFAIVMTLLVLEIIADEVTGAASAAELHKALLELWPKVLSYAISFAVAAVFWVHQHADLHHLTHTDNRFLWINIFFLFWISLLPFSAAMLGEHHQYAVASIIYGCNMILASLTLHASWLYAVRNHRLVKPDLGPEVIRQANRRLLVGPPFYALGIAIAFHSPHASYLVYVLMAVLYVVAGLVPRRWRLPILSAADGE